LERPAEGEAAPRPALVQFLDSLTMVEALEIEQVYPGHGEPFSDHRAVIQSQRDRIEQRMAECLQLIERGHRTVAALLAEMYPGQLHLAGLWMLLGYLDLLAARGQVEVQPAAGVWYYTKRKAHAKFP
jgi:glyoxylase-like metal-dependent hydrolase (beta-lactamase superfamily II)